MSDESYFTVISGNELYTNELTPFVAEANDSVIFSNSHYFWDLGDGTTVKSRRVEHVYRSPGVYKVSLVRYLGDGITSKSKEIEVTVTNLIPNLMEWGSSGNQSDFITVSKIADTPYIVNIWNSYQEYSDEVEIKLYSQNSKSVPYDIDDKFIHIKPTWRFYDSDKTPIDGTIRATPVKIYAILRADGIELTHHNTGDGVFVGSYAEVKFYYVDDISSNSVERVEDIRPIVITVSQVLGGSHENLKLPEGGILKYPVIFKPVISRDNTPTQLKITSNGIFPIDFLKYQNTKIPYNIFLADDDGNYIKTNPNGSIGSMSYPITVGLTSDIEVSEVAPIGVGELNKFSYNPFKLGGYYENFFIPLEHTDGETLKITAETDVEVVVNPIIPLYGLFADNNNNRLIKYNFFAGLVDSANYQDIVNNIPNIQEPLVDREISGVFGVSVDGEFNSWVADANNSLIYRYNQDFELVDTIDLTEFSNIIDGVSSPAQVAIDVDNNAYITLFDSGKVIRVDGDSAAVEELNILVGDNDYIDSEGRGSVQPTAIETSLTNVIVSYSIAEPENNLLILFNIDDNEQISQIDTGREHIVDIIGSRDGNTFYAVSINDNTNKSTLFKVSNSIDNFSIELQVPLDGMSQFITISESGHVWVNVDGDKLAKWDGVSGDVQIHHLDNLNSDISVDIITGLTSDSYGNVWLLNNLDKSLMIVNGADMTILSSTEFSSDSDFVAYGDWNGFRWYNKFGYTQTTKTITGLYGESDEFTILPQEPQFNFNKINEDFDAKETLKSYRTTENLLDYDNFFDNFLGGIVGDKNSPNTDLGKVVFERITNFVMNHADPDTCNIRALKSFCLEVGLPIDNIFSCPQTIQRFFDLFSISFKRLWGDDYIGENVEDFVGDKIDINTYMVKVDPQVKFILTEKFNNYHQIITPLFIDEVESNEYPLRDYNESWGWGLSIPDGGRLEDYYDAYNLKELTSERIYSIINWDDHLTTDVRSIDSYDNYMSEYGIAAQLLSNDLRKGLGLFINT